MLEFFLKIIYQGFDETSKVKAHFNHNRIGMGDFVGGLIYLGQQHKCPLVYILM
jgi:hypothetical protein